MSSEIQISLTHNLITLFPTGWRGEGGGGKNPLLSIRFQLSYTCTAMYVQKVKKKITDKKINISNRFEKSQKSLKCGQILLFWALFCCKHIYLDSNNDSTKRNQVIGGHDGSLLKFMKCSDLIGARTGGPLKNFKQKFPRTSTNISYALLV